MEGLYGYHGLYVSARCDPVSRSGNRCERPLRAVREICVEVFTPRSELDKLP
jgi:hypothetical protein